MKTQTCLMLMLYSAAVIGLGGCNNQSAFERTQVEGIVTLNGTPVEQGVITFIPAGKGASAGAKIESGKFVIPKETGPSPGEYKVEIDSSIPTGKQILDTDGETMVTEYANGIPPRFNRQTELTVTLKEGNNQQLFDLETK
ncbi:hypothetical protein [Gimesia sp.]|uniref:hypothetical protein n=1 Tax=Gimesia sp. TaxID=2024833 RepID=UPI003A906423